MQEKLRANCAHCPYREPDRICREPDGRGPEDCATRLYAQQVEESRRELEQNPELMRFARESALQEAACYGESPFDAGKRMPLKPRILEVIEFANRMGYHRLGLGFCLGLQKEARALVEVLESHGFEVVSACCKVGTTDKSFLGLDDDGKIFCGFEAMCNPIAQAKILNAEHCELNLMLGLCVGHDSLFLKYSEAPATVVAVKDRLLGHAPLNALYSNYYAFLKK